MNWEIEILKILGLRGALNGFITVTSSELAEDLGTSQQTASNRILSLLKNGSIERKMGTRHQRIKITARGKDMLCKEYADYMAMFKPVEKIIMKGTVSAGLGEGQYYVAQYADQFKTSLGFKPFEGTLNLTVDEENAQKLSHVPRSAIIEIKSFKADGRSFGKVSCIPARIRDVQCAIVIPKRSHHINVIEVLAQYHLRKNLKIEEGEDLEIIIDIE